MPRLAFLFPLVFGLGAATAASAPPAPAGAALRFMAGECDRLAMPGSAGPRGCRPALVNMVYETGAVSFVFAGKDGRLLSFRSRIERQRGDQTLLAVEQVTIVGRGGAAVSSQAARGQCLLTPFAVERSRVDCSARAGGQRFAATFRTSEDKPRFVTLPSA